MRGSSLKRFPMPSNRLFSDIAALWLTVGLSCLAHAAEPTKVIPVTSGGVLAESNVRYVLNQDITSSDTAFAIGGSNVILDLNGHTVTFDDSPVGIANPSFEEGDGEVPSGWDLSKAPSARRASNSAWAMTGKWHLEFRNAQASEEIVSTWTELPPGQWGTVYFHRGNAVYLYPELRYSFLVEREDGAIVAAEENTALEYGFLEFRIPREKKGRYRLRFRVLNAPQANAEIVTIDLLDLRAAHNFGVYIGYGGDDGDPGRRPDWNIAESGGNVTIMNGTIIQGRAGSFRGAAVYAYPASYLTVRNVKFQVWGLETDAVTIYYSNNGIIENNVVTSGNPYKLNRGQLSSPINIMGGARFRISGNTINSGTGWGCITLSDVAKSDVFDNHLKTSSTVVNHHAINAYNVQETNISNNLIEADPGQGIILSTNSQNNLISGNDIHLKSQAPSPEIFRHSLDAIRLNDYDGLNVSGNRIVGNRIYLTGYNDPFYQPASQIVNGIANRGTGPGNIFENNYIYVHVIDENVTGSGIEPGSLDANEVIFRNNVIESNSVNVMFGGYVRHNHHTTFISNTFIKSDKAPAGYSSPPEGGGKGVKGYATLSSRAGDSSVKNTHFIDSRLVNGASLENPVLGYAFGDYSYFVDWYLTVTAKNTQGLPVAGAWIVIQDKNGASVFNGASDAHGQIKNIVLNQYEHYGRGMASTSYFRYGTPHKVTISASGYQTQAKEVAMDSSKIMEISLTPLDAKSGDLNGDGKLDAGDYMTIRKLINTCQRDAAFMPAADFNKDGCITYADYVIWYKYYSIQ